NPTAWSQGFPTNFTELTAVTSHEVAEASTDPNVDYKALAWYDDRYDVEIGDLTQYAVRVLNGYYVQLLIDRNDRLLSVAGAYLPQSSYAPTGGPGGLGFDAVNVANSPPRHHTPRLADDFVPWWGIPIGRGT